MATDSFVVDACAVLSEDIDRLEPLIQQLEKASSWDQKIQYLYADPVVRRYLSGPSLIKTVLATLSLRDAYLILSVSALGQAELLFNPKHLSDQEYAERITDLIDSLVVVEKFYGEIGGIIGYHLSMIKCLCRPQERSYGLDAMYHAPKMIDISERNHQVNEAIYSCIENLADLAELYPVGGAADRLRLYDPMTGQSLPAATLNYCGMTLLERLVRDVQVKEYLYFKFKNKQLTLPIAMMTSTEKNNHERIINLCRDKNFFQRDQQSFFFFCQPCVPTIDQNGHWGLRGALQPLLRPGGHGVIWKLARDSGCFDWLKKQGVQKILVRQINNPVASEDYGLYAFAGLGLKHNRSIGFCSCPRLVQSAEGTNILIEECKGGGFEQTLTNIEYCDFDKYGILDEPAEPGQSFSKYPSNTNLLFVDIEAIEQALITSPIPGMLVNLKKISYQDEFGLYQEKLLARLESMMQNIADSFTEKSSCAYTASAISLPSFITFNTRSKTISTTKKERVGPSFLETPEGCFIDMMKNSRELLNQCGFLIDPKQTASDIPFSFLYHPALGPFYSIIAQKLRVGRIIEGSELYLSIAELDAERIDIDGSLQIIAEQVMGHANETGLLRYSAQAGKCTLKNVSVRNNGINYSKPALFWKGSVSRLESCYIEIRGDGEFVAEDLCFIGPYHIVVEAGTRVIARQVEDRICFDVEPIKEASWSWDYAFNSDRDVVLKKKSGNN